MHPLLECRPDRVENQPSLLEEIFFFSLFFPIRYCFCSIGWICLRCSLFLSILREFLQEINKVCIYSNLFQTCVLVTFYRRRSRAYSILSLLFTVVTNTFVNFMYLFSILYFLYLNRKYNTPTLLK